MLALEDGKFEIAEYLIKHGSDVNSVDDLGQSALLHITRGERRDCSRIIRILLQCGKCPWKHIWYIFVLINDIYWIVELWINVIILSFCNFRLQNKGENRRNIQRRNCFLSETAREKDTNISQEDKSEDETTSELPSIQQNHQILLNSFLGLGTSLRTQRKGTAGHTCWSCVDPLTQAVLELSVSPQGLTGACSV